MTFIDIIWGVQLVVCLWLGPKVARRTGRSVLNWVIMGFFVSIIFPPIGLVLMLLCYFFYPPAMPRVPRHGANPGELHDRKAGSRKI